MLLNAVIGFAQEHAAERTAEALQALVPATARVIRDGELTEIPAVDLVPGDLVMLDAGDAISIERCVLQFAFRRLSRLGSTGSLHNEFEHFAAELL